MKRVLILGIALIACVAAMFALCKSNGQTEMENEKNNKTEKILFINGSPNKDGNTATLAKALLEGRDYETLMLTDYRINFYGQTLEGDQFNEIVKKMRKVDVVVIGSPVYWHNVCASVRTFIERFYGTIEPNSFSGKKFFFLYQGAAPTKMMIDDGEYTMSRFAGMYGFSYEGMATSKKEAKTLGEKLK